MGEMADFYIAQEMDAFGWSPWGRGTAPTTVVCNRCGARGLKWKETPAGWRLFSKKLQHTCAQPASP